MRRKKASALDRPGLKKCKKGKVDVRDVTAVDTLRAKHPGKVPSVGDPLERWGKSDDARCKMQEGKKMTSHSEGEKDPTGRRARKCSFLFRSLFL